MAVKKYTNTRGTFFEAFAYVDGKHIHKKGFKTKTEANKWIEHTRVLGVEKSPLDLTYEDIYNEWIETYEASVAEATLRKTKGYFKNQILPAIGKQKIGKISKKTLQKTINDWSKNYVRFDQYVIYMKKVFKYAVQENYINKNPSEFLIMPKTKTIIEDKTCYTAEEVNQLLETCKNDDRAIIYPLFRLILFTGIRRGEAMALQWKHIDLNQGTLDIKQSITTDIKGKPIIGQCKTISSNRVLSLDNETVSALKMWRVKLMELALIQRQTFDNEVFVFPQVNDFHKHKSFSYMQKTLKGLCKKANLPLLSFHKLRHTHCTLLIESGVNIKDVQVRLGHSDIKTTLDVYAHSQANKKEVVERFSDFLSNSLPARHQSTI